MQRRSRRDHTRGDNEVQNNPRAANTLLSFNHHRLLPTNALHALNDPDGSYDGYRHLCTRMVRAGLLYRFTFNGTKNVNETMTYGRTKAGEDWLIKYHYPCYSEYSTAQDDEQVLIDLVDAAFKIGCRSSDVEFHDWNDIKEHPLTPELPKNPFNFPYEKGHIIPDGLPHYKKRGQNSILFIKEVVRTNNRQKPIRYKVQAYKHLEQQIKTRYGFKSLMVLFIARNDFDRAKILAIIQQEFPQGCKWILVNQMLDPIEHHSSTPPIPLQLFNEPWDRIGYSKFSLKTLSAVE